MRHYPPLKPRNTAGHWSAGRDRAAQAAFRAMLIHRDGLQCANNPAHPGPYQAHHDTPTDGRLLCEPCHCATDPYARRTRHHG